MKHLTIKRHQRGFSPVELLVGMALGLFLLLALAQMFLGTRASTRHEENLARMQEGGRISIELLTREIRKAGYRSDPLLQRDNIFPPMGPFGLDISVAATTSSISLRYQGGSDNLTQLCGGTTISATITAWQTLTVALPSQDLTCLSASVDASTGVANTPTTQAFVPNIESMFVLAGMDTTGDGEPDSYVDPATVLDWRLVVSLNIRVRVVSDSDNLVDTAQTYRDFNDMSVTPSDRKLRRTYSTVVSLRNLRP